MPQDRFEFAEYGTLSATAVWTLGWIAISVVAANTALQAPSTSSFVALAVSGVVSIVGIRVTIIQATLKSPQCLSAPEPDEPWPKKVFGWFAWLFWSGCGIAWNLAILGTQLSMAHNGRGGTILVLLPLSLVGWFLLAVVFVGIGALIDSVIGLARRN